VDHPNNVFLFPMHVVGFIPFQKLSKYQTQKFSVYPDDRKRLTDGREKYHKKISFDQSPALVVSIQFISSTLSMD